MTLASIGIVGQAGDEKGHCEDDHKVNLGRSWGRPGTLLHVQGIPRTPPGCPGGEGLREGLEGCSRGHGVGPGAPRVPRGAPRGCLASEQRFCSQDRHCLTYSKCCQGHSRPGAGGLRLGAPAVSAGYLDPWVSDRGGPSGCPTA